MSEKVFLWVNLTDLDAMGTVGPFGSALNFMIQPSLGDELLDGGCFDRSRVDEVYVVIHCTPDRATAITEALEVIGKRKLRRKVRTRITQQMPKDGKWHLTVAEPVTVPITSQLSLI